MGGFSSSGVNTGKHRIGITLRFRFVRARLLAIRKILTGHPVLCTIINGDNTINLQMIPQTMDTTIPVRLYTETVLSNRSLGEWIRDNAEIPLDMALLCVDGTDMSPSLELILRELYKGE